MMCSYGISTTNTIVNTIIIVEGMTSITQYSDDAVLCYFM